MEFGFSLPSRGPTASMENLRTLAQHADARRLDSVWHMVFDVMALEVADLQHAMDRFVQEIQPGVNA